MQWRNNNKNNGKTILPHQQFHNHYKVKSCNEHISSWQKKRFLSIFLNITLSANVTLLSDLNTWKTEMAHHNTENLKNGRTKRKKDKFSTRWKLAHSLILVVSPFYIKKNSLINFYLQIEIIVFLDSYRIQLLHTSQ